MNNREVDNIMSRARSHFALSFDVRTPRKTEEWWAIRDEAWRQFDEALNEIKAAAWLKGEQDCAENFLRVMAYNDDLKTNPYAKETNA